MDRNGGGEDPGDDPELWPSSGSQARQLHAWLVDQNHHRRDHPQHRFLSNLLMEMYGKCGSPDDAANVFSALARPNLFSWTILLTALADNGLTLQARRVFNAMPCRDVVAWNALLAAFCSAGCIQHAKLIHAKMPHWNASSWNAILSANTEAGQFSEAAEMLDRIPQPDAISWTILMGAYARSGMTEHSVAVFEHRIPSGRDVVVWNALVLAYAAAGQVEFAARTFGCMPQHDQVASNVMLHAYCAAGRMPDASHFFNTVMLTRDTVSWNVLLQGRVRLGQLDEARDVFDTMPRGTRTVLAWNSLLGLFAVSSEAKLHSLPERMPAWDTTTWNIIVAAFAGAGKLQNAMDAFHSMPCKSNITWNIVVAANAAAGNLEQAEYAMSLFPATSTNTWNGLIAGYARHSYVGVAFERFRDMILCGIPPDGITFVCLLVACSHAGLTAAACGVFCSILSDWQMTPTAEHYSCVVDSATRSGQLALAQTIFDLVLGSACPVATSHDVVVLATQLKLAQ